MSTLCPRCTGRILSERNVQGVAISACEACGGLLVPQPRLVPLLRAMTGDLDIAAEAEIPPAPKSDPAGPCPRCGSQMQGFGYMGMKLATLDRCEPCGLLWIDANELDTVAMLFARTERRSRDRQAGRAEREAELSKRVDRTLLRRKMRLALGFTGLGVLSEAAGAVVELVVSPTRGDTPKE